MLGRNHAISTVAFCASILFALLDRSLISFSSSVLFLFGSAVGSILPDSDVNGAEIFRKRNGKTIPGFSLLLNIIGYVTRYVFYKPLVFVLKHTLFPELKKFDRHRGFLHSFIGMFSVVLFWTIVLAALEDFLSVSGIVPFAIPFNPVLFFNAGILSGYFLHLFQDSLTVSGVPFFAGIRKSNYEFHGKQHTSSKIPFWKFWKGDKLVVLSFLLLSIVILVVSLNMQLRYVLAVSFLGPIIIFLSFGKRS